MRVRVGLIQAAGWCQQHPVSFAAAPPSTLSPSPEVKRDQSVLDSGLSAAKWSPVGEGRAAVLRCAPGVILAGYALVLDYWNYLLGL